MKELTLGQRMPLFKLVRYQATQEREPVFAVQQGHDVGITTWDNRAGEEVITSIPRETLVTWQEGGYVSISDRTLGGRTILLHTRDLYSATGSIGL